MDSNSIGGARSEILRIANIVGISPETKAKVDEHLMHNDYTVTGTAEEPSLDLLKTTNNPSVNNPNAVLRNLTLANLPLDEEKTNKARRLLLEMFADTGHMPAADYYDPSTSNLFVTTDSAEIIQEDSQRGTGEYQLETTGTQLSLEGEGEKGAPWKTPFARSRVKLKNPSTYKIPFQQIEQVGFIYENMTQVKTMLNTPEIQSMLQELAKNPSLLKNRTKFKTQIEPLYEEFARSLNLDPNTIPLKVLQKSPPRLGGNIAGTYKADTNTITLYLDDINESNKKSPAPQEWIAQVSNTLAHELFHAKQHQMLTQNRRNNRESDYLNQERLADYRESMQYNHNPKDSATLTGTDFYYRFSPKEIDAYLVGNAVARQVREKVQSVKPRIDRQEASPSALAVNDDDDSESTSNRY